MSTSVTIDFSRFNAQVERYITELRMDASEVIQTQARLFLQQAMKFTPPKTQAQGKKAVETDLRALFLPIREFTGGQRKDGKVFLWNTSKGPVFANEADFLAAPDLKTIKFQHERHKGPTGRVSWHGRYLFMENKGGHFVVNKIVLPRRKFDEYLKRIQKHVGRLRAGWAPAIKALGGQLPGWVTRNVEGAKGDFMSNLAQRDHPAVTIVNRALGVKGIARYVHNALEVRVKSMAKDIRVKLGQAKKIF